MSDIKVKEEVKVADAKAAEKVSEVNSVESNVDESVVEEKMLKLCRVPYTSKQGTPMNIYMVKGVMRGRKVEASMAPRDRGGYNLLDIVFGDQSEVDLVVERTSRVVNYTTNAKTYSTVFHAHSVDENGVPYDCIVAPREASDRQILTHLLAQIGVYIN